MSQEPKSLIEYFYHWEATTPNKVFMRQPSGSTWKEITFAQAGKEARSMVTAMKALGLQPKAHVGIYSKNCYHWILADLAIMMGDYISVPFYASLPKDQLAQVIALGDLDAMFAGKLDSWGDKGEIIPENVKVIKFPHYKGNAEVTMGHDWNDLVAKHDATTENFVSNLDDLWTIKFTSGTTGTPKGVMHIHRTPALIIENERKTKWLGMFEMKAYRFLSFLPLNHVGERLGLEAPALSTGGTISFADSLDTFAKNIQDTQPTLFFAVPRIWMKFYLGVLSKMPQKRLDMLLKIPIVSGIIKKKLRTALGMRDVEIAATGAAITPKFLKDWYAKLDIHLVEAYGMTEVCGSMTNSPKKINAPWDSVGKAIPGGEVKIHPDTGEILMKSPYMMTGYYKNPEKTAEELVDGWMHSGDRGSIDQNGFLRVHGRVKDAFKTSKGSYVTPNKMEEILSDNDCIEQCCVAGLGIPQPVCLVNLSENAKTKSKEEINALLLKDLEAMNAKLANFERVSTVIVNKDVWSVENDLITPTLKVKRGKIDDIYGQKYLGWHESKEKVIWE